MLPDDSQAWTPADDEPPDDENTVYSDDDVPDPSSAPLSSGTGAVTRSAEDDFAQAKQDPEAILRDLDWMVRD
jgi:hypothetical protein